MLHNGSKLTGKRSEEFLCFLAASEEFERVRAFRFDETL
jgi:hypothetical protein